MGRKKGKLYKLNARAKQLGQERINYASSKRLTWDQWHRRYGHIAIGALRQLDREELVTSLNIDHASIPSPMLTACIPGKQHHKPFPAEAEHRLTTVGERIMADLWGPVSVRSIGQFNLFMGLMDNSSRFGQVLFLRDKTQAPTQIEYHCEQVKRQTGKYPRWLRVDNGK